MRTGLPLLSLLDGEDDTEQITRQKARVTESLGPMRDDLVQRLCGIPASQLQLASVLNRGLARWIQLLGHVDSWGFVSSPLSHRGWLAGDRFDFRRALHPHGVPDLRTHIGSELATMVWTTSSGVEACWSVAVPIEMVFRVP